MKVYRTHGHKRLFENEFVSISIVVQILILAVLCLHFNSIVCKYTLCIEKMLLFGKKFNGCTVAQIKLQKMLWYLL